jgi:hypothetical protein
MWTEHTLVAIRKIGGVTSEVLKQLRGVEVAGVAGMGSGLSKSPAARPTERGRNVVNAGLLFLLSFELIGEIAVVWPAERTVLASVVW